MHHLLSLTLMILFILLSNASVHGATLPLAWMSDREGDVDVYLWDGEKAINVSRNPKRNFMPVWSNDGRLAWWGSN